MRVNKHVDKSRNRDGSSFIEIAIASVALGVIVFIGLDAYVWNQAFMINDLACRDACRAAAQASSPTNTKAAYITAAKAAAQRELDLHIVPSPWISNPQLVNSGFLWQDYGASNGNPMPAPPQTPYVRVQTSLDVSLPVPISFMGQTVLQGGAGQKLVFQRSYSMPIVQLPPP